MLRLKAASSAVEDFTTGSFRPVINDEQNLDAAKVTKVLFCSGKIYWDLLAESQKRNDGQTAIVRVEQLYPTPVAEMQAAIAPFSNAQLRWVQDEPLNQGPWTYMVCLCRSTTSTSLRLQDQLRHLPHLVLPSVTQPSRLTLSSEHSRTNALTTGCYFG
jgi:2-oxoglutarate dehydrogenase complex dehydrogenase (E1) component-like enzyme